MIYARVLFVALWRWWLGRGEEGWPAFMRRADGRAFPGATYVQYAIELAGVYFLSAGPWNIALTNAVGLLVLARCYRHGQILSGPGEADPGGVDYIWNLAKRIPSDEGKWWAYGLIRYCVPAAAWAGALQAQGHQAGWLLVAAAVVLVGIYRLCWAARDFLTRISFIYRESAGHVQFAELGWFVIGIAMALAA